MSAASFNPRDAASSAEYVTPRSLDDALVLFRDGIQRSDGDGLKQHLQSSLRRICSLAHEERVMPESLLVRLKTALDASAAVHELAHSAREDFRARVVTFAIAAYYADENFLKGDGNAAPPPRSGARPFRHDGSDGDGSDGSGDGRV